VFVSEDTNTQGNWQGVYGSDGYSIIGNQSSYPVYSAVTTSNATTQVWKSTTSDVRALQDANTTGGTARTAAGWSSTSGSFSIDVNLPDGNTHVVSIYADDWNNMGLSERVDVIDPSTGAVLDSRTISSFAGGVYLSWQLTSNIQLRFTALTGLHPVVSGIFFDHVDSQAFVAANTHTRGNWQGAYGNDGYDIAGYQANLPSYAEVTPTNVTDFVWNPSTTDQRVLANPAPGATTRVAGCWYNSTGQFSIDINLTDGQSHVVTVYAHDFDKQGRSERVDVIDPSTGAVLDSRTISKFSGGTYLSWQLSGNVQIRVTAITGPNPVISGIFFGRVVSATFVSANTYSHGDWEGVFGRDGYDVIGNQSSLPSYARVTTTNTSTTIWKSSTTDYRALEKATPGGFDRIAGCWYSPTGQFSININLTDGQSHVVSIYAVDWDNQGRSERVDVIDPSTGKVLDSRTLSSLYGGTYLTWKLQGNVQLRFTVLKGPSPVVSGLFFG
jgi:hypothetical protein